jgi:PAS domain S-box-containing protein
MFTTEEDPVFRAFFLCNPLPMWFFDHETLRFLAVNEAAVRRYGWSVEEFLQMTIEEIRPPGELQKLRRYRALNQNAPSPGYNQTIFWKHRTKSGAVIDVESTWLEMDFRGRRAVLVLVMDRTQQFRAEERAREQAAMLDLASDAIFVHDLEARVLSWNQGAARLYGWSEEEAAGACVDDLFQTDRAAFDAAFSKVRETGEWQGELKQSTRNGEEVYVSSRWTLIRDSAGQPASVLVINTNITEARHLEQQVLRAQRLESIGTLASGIAHDLNNILSPILMAAGLLKRQFEHDTDAVRILDIITSSAERGAGVVKQVLTFARGAEGQRVAVQPRHLVNDLAKIMAQTFPRNIDIQTACPPDLWVIHGEPNQLHQVLLNLCVNARDAIQSVPSPEPGQGPEPVRSLSITVENTEIDQHFARMNPGAKLGPHVVIRITDTGVGIAPEVIDKIFDPFFTTKEPGKGTGLGLATVLGIVRSHDGFLTVQSKLGLGTTFQVFLPANEDFNPCAGLPEAGGPPGAGNGELILVVDDEAPIREALVGTLEANGYRCFTAEDGTDALAVYFSRRDEIDLVLTDLAMAQMDGVKLSRSLRRFDPQVRIVISSGHIQKEAAQELVALGVRHFLEKPYNADKLLRVLRQALDAYRPG